MVLYTNNVPQATQTIAFTQPLIQANFEYLPLFGNVDHNFASDSTDGLNGFHKKVTFSTKQANVLPGPGIGAGTGVLYEADVVTGPASAKTPGLCFQYSGGTYAVTGILPNPSDNGYTCLPGGIILQWGFVSRTFSSTGGTGTITYPTPFPVKTLFATLIGFSTASTGDKVLTFVIDDDTNNTTLAYDYQLSGSTSNYIGLYWAAIGR